MGAAATGRRMDVRLPQAVATSNVTGPNGALIRTLSAHAAQLELTGSNHQGARLAVSTSPLKRMLRFRRPRQSRSADNMAAATGRRMDVRLPQAAATSNVTGPNGALIRTLSAHAAQLELTGSNHQGARPAVSIPL